MLDSDGPDMQLYRAVNKNYSPDNPLGSFGQMGFVAIGSDFNGFSGMPAPRFGFDACGWDFDLLSYEAVAPVAYPFALHGLDGSMGRMQAGMSTRPVRCRPATPIARGHR